MAEKLDFSFPEKKSKGPATGALTVALLLAVAGLAVANLIVASRVGKPQPTAGPQGFSAAQAKELAAKLAQRNLHEQAAAVWQDYLGSADLTEAERAKALFQIATSFEKAGRYADAIESYYRCEATAPLDELSSQINAHIRQCFEKLGKFSSLRYEMMERTSLNPSEPAGGRVVAEIGAEKITEAQLEALIESQVDTELVPMQAYVTPLQYNQRKASELERLRDSQMKQRFLEDWLTQELLYREALDQQLSEKPQIKRLLQTRTRELLARRMLEEQLASKVHITEGDVQTYYAANKDEYMEPESAAISHILVADKGQALELLEQSRAGADFATLAKEYSLDTTTAEAGGKISGEVYRGRLMPFAGDVKDLEAAIFAADAPEVLGQPFQTQAGWELVRVDERRLPRQLDFEEVHQQVARDLRIRKAEDVQREYIGMLMDKYDVILHRRDPTPVGQDESQESTLQQ
jgi:parvulin-like peptidyl-prolyl isomerase